MNENSIYQDIAQRTGGDIYIGVTGPVRTGKSTFIKRFMEEVVLPGMEDENLRGRTRDELPQSASGRTVMTTEPKFIPEEAGTVSVGKAALRVKLIDCVGYLVPQALGQTEEGEPRMVQTPWADTPMPFAEAAEIASSPTSARTFFTSSAESPYAPASSTPSYPIALMASMVARKSFSA